jgi:signal transduction histidine kinase
VDTNTNRDHRQRLPPWSLFVSGVALALALALAMFYSMAQPPMSDLVALVGILSVTAALSIALGHVAFRRGWVDRSPRLSWTLLGGYALSNLLAFLSVWVTALLMFVNPHDFALATVTLLFAGSIAISLGYLLSVSLARRISNLNQAAGEIAQGHLDVRVPVSGEDELADLGDTFNAMAAQLERAERQQRELDNLRRELVTWVGHDLRTPLTSIRVVVEALADGVVENPTTVDRYLKTAQHHIRSLSRLLDDLLEIAQIEAGRMKLDRYASSIRDVISDTIEAFSTLASRQGVRLEGSTEPDVDPVFMDVPKIERVLVNLLDNALRHTSAGGIVRVNAFTTSDGVRVEVQDSGGGIRADDLSHVFERIYRGKEERPRDGGAGLGLAIVKGIVEAHGGAIGIESRLGEGTCVWFTLPRDRESSSVRQGARVTKGPAVDGERPPCAELR